MIETEDVMIRALFVIGVVALFPAGLGTDAKGEPSTCLVTEPIRAEPPRDPNADRFGVGPWYVNADRTIWAGWDAVRMVAGARGNKVLWIRPQGTQLTISGRRIDADASPATATIPCCYRTGFQASGLAFPTEGCWQISAKAGTSELTFVTRIGPEPPSAR
jgi:hypothetical protein